MQSDKGWGSRPTLVKSPESQIRNELRVLNRKTSWLTAFSLLAGRMLLDLFLDATYRWVHWPHPHLAVARDLIYGPFWLGIGAVIFNYGLGGRRMGARTRMLQRELEELRARGRTV